jgi:hypothetical protein
MENIVNATFPELQSAVPPEMFEMLAHIERQVELRKQHVEQLEQRMKDAAQRIGIEAPKQTESERESFTSQAYDYIVKKYDLRSQDCLIVGYIRVSGISESCRSKQRFLSLESHS